MNVSIVTLSLRGLVGESPHCSMVWRLACFKPLDNKMLDTMSRNARSQIRNGQRGIFARSKCSSKIAHMGGRLLRRHQGIESTSCEGKGQTPHRNRVKISTPSAGALDEDRPLGFGKGRLFAITISKIPRRIRFIGRKPYSPTRTRMPVSAWLRLILRELLACSCTLLVFPKRKT